MELGIEGIPITQMAKALGVSPNAIKLRLSHRGIKPFGYIGRVSLYTVEDWNAIRESLPRGKKSPKYGKISAAVKQAMEQLNSQV